MRELYEAGSALDPASPQPDLGRSHEEFVPTLEIRPPSRWSPVRLSELWQYRELLYFLAQRDLKVRYKQAAIGFAWAVIQPVLMMVIFTLFLGKLAHVPSEGLPYSVFALSGLIPWLFFANGVGAASDSLVSNTNLISKVYCPRLVIPMAALAAWLPDLAVASVVLVALMAIYGIAPAATVVFLPIFVLLGVVSALAVGLWVSALNVAYRDIRYAVPFFIQMGLFATPVTYPATLVHSPLLRSLFALNPMSGVVEGFRWALLGGHAPWLLVGESAIVAVVVLVAGLLYFRRVEQFFADVI